MEDAGPPDDHLAGLRIAQRRLRVLRADGSRAAPEGLHPDRLLPADLADGPVFIRAHARFLSRSVRPRTRCTFPRLRGPGSRTSRVTGSRQRTARAGEGTGPSRGGQRDRKAPGASRPSPHAPSLRTFSTALALPLPDRRPCLVDTEDRPDITAHERHHLEGRAQRPEQAGHSIGRQPTRQRASSQRCGRPSGPSRPGARRSS